jgi:PAS domain S-box-containing protein
MVQFNTRANEILLKLVYYGPGLSGKTTNLQTLHAMCRDASRGELFSVNTQEDRTLFFDLLPINLGVIFGNAIHLQVYTVPGQVQYDASRRVVLSGADGVVFVADSSEAKMQDNVDSLSNLYHNLNANRLNIKQIPFVLQYNKRDLHDAMPVGVMNRRLNFRNVPYFESVAYKGPGVLDTFLSIVRDTVGTTFKKYHLDKKIKDFDELLGAIDTNINACMGPLPLAEVPIAPQPRPEGTVLRSTTASVADLLPGKVADAQDLLEDALKSNMDTARLYSEVKQLKDTLEKKNEEMGQIHGQLEKANQDNLKTRRYLEGLIQSVGEAIISFSHDGRILTWNTAAERIFGYSRSEIVGRSMQQLAPDARQGELEQAVAQVDQGNMMRDIPTARLRKGGVEFPVTITYAPIRGSDDRVLAFSAVVRDLGEQRNLEKKVRDAEESSTLNRILPTVLNEVANRVAAIQLNKSLLLQEVSDPEAARRVVRLVQTLDALQNLLKPVLMIFSPNSMRVTSSHLNTLVQEAAARVEPEAEANGVAMEYTLDPGVDASSLDADLLREALVNLFRHGIAASSRSSAKRLRIGTRQVGTTLQLVCQDSGPAIPETELSAVFDPSVARDVDALGLSVALSVFQAHGGRITVRSQDGIGNAFLGELPLSDISTPQTQGPGLAGRTVLVVDDESFLLECLTDALTAWGCQVTPCSLAAEAIQKLQEGKYDLIVSDIRMPGLTGIQLFDWIKAQMPAMTSRILYTTGDAFDPETRAFLERSRRPHLGKPFDLKRFKLALEDLLQ